MENELSQISQLVKHCCQRRPEGGRYLFLGLTPEQLSDCEDLNKHWDVDYVDPEQSADLVDRTPRLIYDLIYIHRVLPGDSVIDVAYQWGPKVKGGGALAGWGYRDPEIYQRLLTVIGDCPSKWPDIWALPIVEG